MNRKVTLILGLAIAACAGGEDLPTPSNTPPSRQIPNPYLTTNFSFYHTSLDSSSVIAVGDTMQRHYQRIVADLNSDALPRIQVHFYKSYNDLRNAVRATVPDLPQWAIGLATAQDQIHFISPRHPAYDYQDMLGNLVHELAHCVSLHVNPSISNNPRWLWESVAIYESNQFIHPSHFAYMTGQTPPTLEELNSLSNTYVYDVGYLLAEYIVSTRGKSTLNELVRNNGDLQVSLGMTSAQFQAAWFGFVKSKYNI